MKDVERHIERLLADLDTAWPGGYVAVLFGSAARGEYIPGWSDINVLLITPELGLETLQGIREPLRRWREAAEALPLLFSATEWSRAADAYPLEIAEMRTGYRTLRGKDPLAGAEVHAADLRAALEREFRGKLMRLRQGYALYGAAPADLTEFLRHSASSVLLLCRGLLILQGRAVPGRAHDVIAAAADLVGFDRQAIQRVADRRAEEAWRCGEEDVRGYLAAVERAASFVDHIQTGVRT
jgi:predicted nucleotidyltransferase